MEEQESNKEVNHIKIGDIEVLSTKENLVSCVKTAKQILRNKTISKYLNVDLPKKRFNGF